ncbi:MAG: D-glycerate dehydrogenase [Nannocystaceae bacterium]
MSAPRPHVVVTRGLPEGWLAPLEAACTLTVGPPEPGGVGPELRRALARADGLFCLLTERIDRAVLDAAPGLRVVSTMAVGVDNIDVAACTARGIPVGNTPGVLTDATADLTMALLLACARRLPEAAADARAGRWTTWSPTGWLGIDLRGRVLGVIGLGAIGQAVARRARAFGMSIVYAGPSRRAEAEAALDARRLPLAELLAASDVVTLHAPRSPSTERMIDADALARMRPGAILINTARGSIVDPDALFDALQRRTIAAAAIDVTDPEPLPAGHRLFGLENLLVTPHVGSATADTRRRMAAIACDNLLAGLEGRRLPACVNPEVYDRGVAEDRSGGT